jgi:hypothetical protein
MRYGGSRGTEGSVERGLRWLAEQQQPDGGWGEGIEDCSLALLSFLGAGHTEKVGQFKANVRMAIAWLTARLGADGRIGGDAYEQALAVAALCEASGMARVAATCATAQKALDDLCLMKEWGDPAVPDALSNAWVVLALKSGKVAGCVVPMDAFERAIWYLDAVQDDHGLVKSLDGKPDIQACACAALCRLFMGWKREENSVAEPVRVLDERVVGTELDRPDGLHLRYFGTLVMFQQGGDFWRRWNEWNKKVLIETQGGGTENNGSWVPNGIWIRGHTQTREFNETRRAELAQAMATAAGKPEDGSALKALVETLSYADDTALLERMLEPVGMHKDLRVLLLLRLGLVRSEMGQIGRAHV